MIISEGKFYKAIQLLFVNLLIVWADMGIVKYELWGGGEIPHYLENANFEFKYISL